MTTCEPLPQSDLLPMELPLMQSAAGSRARILALQEVSSGWTWGRAAGFGLKSTALLAKFDPRSSLLKTSQTCFLAQRSGREAGLAAYSQTWPDAGMMLNGEIYQLRSWALHIVANVFGLLPTPRANDSQKRGNFDITNPRNGFPTAVKRLFLPTIGKQEPKGAGRNRFRGSPHFRGAKMSEGLRICADDPIYLHPSFAEAAMGFPIGWTELAPAVTPSSRKSPNS